VTSSHGRDSLEDNKEHILCEKVNEVYVKINCERHIAQELSEFFTFFVPGHQFVPAFRNRIWDGKIRLFDSRNYQLYIGLIPYLEEFCKERDYTYSHDEVEEEYSTYHAKKFIEGLNLPFEVREVVTWWSDKTWGQRLTKPNIAGGGG